jgi:HupE / UreJ protein
VALTGSVRSSIGLGVVFVAVAVSAWAHTGGSTGYAAITVSRSTVRYSLTLPAATLPSDLAEALRLGPTGSPASRDKLLGVIRSQVVLHADGVRCESGPGEVLASAPGAPSFTMLVDFACPSAVRELVVRDNTFDVLGADHHTLAKVEAPSGVQQFAFAPDSREARFTIGGGDGLMRSTGSFVLLGVEHILTGYDHLLFLLGLLLRGGSWVGLAKIITAFTLAHSVTLALAVLDIVVLPDRLVEAVIALSIAFVAAENIFLRPVVSRRWLVSFCFGLVHGFGFSSVLRELGLPSHGLALALLGFNAGVELGQGLVVAVALPLLAFVRHTGWERRVVWSSSLAILVVGVVLFVERAFF